MLKGNRSTVFFYSIGTCLNFFNNATLHKENSTSCEWRYRWDAWESRWYKKKKEFLLENLLISLLPEQNSKAMTKRLFKNDFHFLRRKTSQFRLQTTGFWLNFLSGHRHLHGVLFYLFNSIVIVVYVVDDDDGKEGCLK